MNDAAAATAAAAVDDDAAEHLTDIQSSVASGRGHLFG